MTLPIGSTLENRYRIEKKLGEGGFGAVYQAVDSRLNVQCAVKESLHVTEEATRQFKREAEMLAKLRHSNLVRVTDYFIIPDQGQYLVMDYVDGIDLHTALTNYGKALPFADTMRWTLQICDALIYIHSQNPPIIHRDIKPANIRVTPQNNAVLVDFGLAKAFEANAKTSTGARGLTPIFASPEQYGMGGTDAQSDIYSLGVTLYCMLTNRVPADSVDIMVGNAEPPPPAKAINKDIPDFVSDALQRAMQIRRTDRYKSVSDFQNAFSAEQKPFAQVKAVAPPAIQVSNFANNKLTLSNGMEFMRVPAGKFIMGSNDVRDNEKPQHTVELSEYLIGKYPVTNLEYQAFVRDAKYKAPEDWKNDPFPAYKGNHPVVYVSWNDASAFCKWLSEKTGEQYRLPTEAEWEKAARGTDGRVYPWGDDFDPKKANTKNTNASEINDGTTSVGKFSPQGDSPYGCADMAGNVFEWCNDWFSDTYYQSTSSSNPLGPNSGAYRVLRGGSCGSSVLNVRSAYRVWVVPSYSGYFIGFRCARSLP